MDLGIVAEGIVELDPMTGRLVLRCEQPEGGNQYIDVQEALERYRGQEVRFVLVPFSTIQHLGEMVDSGELPLEEVPQAGSKPV